MKTVIRFAAAFLLATSSGLSLAHAQTSRYDALANSAMVENRPTPETAKLLKDELLFQRATQTYLWALPLINTLGMKVGSEKQFGAGYNSLPVWKERLDAKTRVPAFLLPGPEQSEASCRRNGSDQNLSAGQAGQRQTDAISGRIGGAGQHAPCKRFQRLRSVEDPG